MTKRSYHVINLLWLQGRRARGKQNNMQVREFCFWILSRYRNDLEQLICIFCSTFLEFSIIFGLALENHYNAQKRCLHSPTPPIVFLAIRRSIQCTSLLVVLFSLRVLCFYSSSRFLSLLLLLPLLIHNYCYEIINRRAIRSRTKRVSV